MSAIASGGARYIVLLHAIEQLKEVLTTVIPRSSRPSVRLHHLWSSKSTSISTFIIESNDGRHLLYLSFTVSHVLLVAYSPRLIGSISDHASFQVHEDAADAFREQGFSVIRKTKLTPEELAEVSFFFNSYASVVFVVLCFLFCIL